MPSLATSHSFVSGHARQLGSARSPAHLGALLVSLALLVSACGGSVSESDLQKWASSETGFQRLAQVIRDAKQPVEVRVRALEVIVEKDQAIRVRGMIDPVPEADRQTIARALVDKLVTQVESRSPTQAQSKDAILSLVRYLTPEQVERVQRAISVWAFSDISWETPAPDLKSKLEARIDAGQIASLGPHGLEPAAILLANGFVAEQMVRYITSVDVPQAKELLLKALRRFLPTYGVNPLYLDAVRRTQDARGAQLLFELYQNQALDQEARDACFTTGALMIDVIKNAPADQKKAVADELLKIGGAGSIDDRWLAAANLLALAGSSRLADVLATLKDDKLYAKDETDTGKRVLDFCLDLQKFGTAAEAEAPLRDALNKGTNVQKSVAVICAKALALEAVKPELGALAANLGKPADVSVADFLGETTLPDGKKAPITLGLLAQNAIEGMGLIAALATATPKLEGEQLDARRFMIVVEFEAVGEPYTKAIDERFAAWLENKAKAPK